MSLKHEIRDTLKKEVLYRSIHRGCKETDHLIGKFVEANLDDFSDEELLLIKDFILEDDLLIYDWIMGRVVNDSKYVDLVKKMQDFHGIELD